jgi:hypothetical protein
MKLHRTLIASLLTACLLTVAAYAADASPAGIWKWTVQGRQGGQGFEQSLKLDYKDGKVTGTLLGRQGGQFSVPDTEIKDASFKDGQLTFTVTREFSGRQFTTKYDGKVEGDTIKGTFERLNVGGDSGAPSKSEWNAKRQK